MNDATSDTLTRAQVAHVFGVHPSTVTKWLAKGRIPAFRTPGGQSKYLRADVEAFLASSVREQEPAQAS